MTGETFRNGSLTTRYAANSMTANEVLQSNQPTGERYRWISEDSSGRITSEDGYSVEGSRYGGRGVTLYGNGEAVAVSYSSSTGSRSTYLGKDILGSVRTATTDTGAVEDRYEYDAFGTVYQGDLSGGMNLGYLGKPYDSATGLYNYGYRDYQPQAARFTTVDPIRDGNNWFAYVNNDPVNWVDLLGLETAILSLPVTPFNKHLFIAVQTEDGTITTKGLYPENWVKAAVDAVFGGTQPSNVITNKNEEYAAAQSYFAGEQLPRRMQYETTITPPSGMTQEEFDQRVLREADNYPLGDRLYNATRGPNSNTFVSEVIEWAGGVLPQIKNATQQDWRCSSR